MNTDLLEELNQEIWINGQAYQLPVVFDFSRYWYHPEFNTRVVVRLNPFDELPILDNIDSRNFGRHLFLFQSSDKVEGCNNKNEIVQALAEFWGLNKTNFNNGGFSYDIEGDKGYYPIALCIPTKEDSRIKILVCFGIKDGESRGPDMAIIYKLARIITDEDKCFQL